MTDSGPGPLSIPALRARFAGRGPEFAAARETPFHRAVGDAVLQELAGLPPGRAVEVGCGAGGILDRLRAAGHVAIGLDAVSAMVVRARAATGAPAVCGDVQALPFAEASVDAVIGMFHLQVVLHPDRAVREAGRVLRRGGHHVLALQAPGWTGEAAARDARELGMTGEDADHLVRCARVAPGSRRFEASELAGLLREAGFADARVRILDVGGVLVASGTRASA